MRKQNSTPDIPWPHAALRAFAQLFPDLQHLPTGVPGKRLPHPSRFPGEAFRAPAFPLHLTPAPFQSRPHRDAMAGMGGSLVCGRPMAQCCA